MDYEAFVFAVVALLDEIDEQKLALESADEVRHFLAENGYIIEGEPKP